VLFVAFVAGVVVGIAAGILACVLYAISQIKNLKL